MELNLKSLSDISPSVDKPTYVPTALRAGVLHLGMGNFHRAHEGVYLHRVAEAGDLGWGTVGVGYRESDIPLNRAAARQDGLYTLETVSPTGESEVAIIGNVVEHLYAPEEASRVLELAGDPDIRIISLTITEGGYQVSDPDDEIDTANPGPLGTIILAAQSRMHEGKPGFTVLSCDNIEMNGDVVRSVLLELAEHAGGPPLVRWIDQNLTFPNSMVDRITPAVTPELHAKRASEGINDAWPVRAETYLQWVVEDEFAAGRPDLEAVGVQLVDNVAPYETMKLRMLNASHQVLGHVGLLAGLEMVDEVVTDPQLGALVRGYMTQEARPTLAPVPGIDLDDYCDQLMARFAAEATRDTLRRQVVDASERVRKFLVPVLADQLSTEADGQPSIEVVALTLAAWFVAAEDGSEIVDQNREGLLAAVDAERGGEEGSFLRYSLVDRKLADHPVLTDRFNFYRGLIGRKGVRAAVSEALTRLEE